MQNADKEYRLVVLNLFGPVVLKLFGGTELQKLHALIEPFEVGKIKCAFFFKFKTSFSRPVES